jgi:hypothetical protein
MRLGYPGKSFTTSAERNALAYKIAKELKHLVQ